jgi:MFS superfamily sulfate permease-like transporter
MWAEARSGPGTRTFLYLVVFLVGLHSILLGIYIYFFTGGFYALVYRSDVENLFFVRQAGLFLFCLGLFYLLPLLELRVYHPLIIVTVFTKALAVAFMLSNARHTSVPGTIQATAVGDGLMAVLLLCAYAVSRIKRVL